MQMLTSFSQKLKKIKQSYDDYWQSRIDDKNFIFGHVEDTFGRRL